MDTGSWAKNIYREVGGRVLPPNVTFEDSESQVTKMVKVLTVVHLHLQCVRDCNKREAYAFGMEAGLYIFCAVQVRNTVVVERKAG
jgi:hypothetical protein